MVFSEFVSDVIVDFIFLKEKVSTGEEQVGDIKFFFNFVSVKRLKILSFNCTRPSISTLL